MRLVPLVAVIVALVAPVDAAALTPAPDDVREAIEGSLNQAFGPVSPGCRFHVGDGTTFKASYVDADPSWALYETDSSTCTSPAILLQKTTAEWEPRYGFDPEDWQPACVDVFEANVPDAVGDETGACLPLSIKAYVPVWDDFKIKPATMHHTAHASFVRLRWTGWGTDRAKARGTLTYQYEGARFRGPVAVTLEDLDHCGSLRTYSRQTVRLTRVKDRRAFPRLNGSWYLPCPEND